MMCTMHGDEVIACLVLRMYSWSVSQYNELDVQPLLSHRSKGQSLKSTKLNVGWLLDNVAAVSTGH